MMTSTRKSSAIRRSSCRCGAAPSRARALVWMLRVASTVQEMQEQMDKMLAGNMSLVSEFGAMRLALQAAIADAFQTPEVIRLFARKEAPTLRVRLAAVDQDHKLGKISPDTYKCVAETGRACSSLAPRAA